MYTKKESIVIIDPSKNPYQDRSLNVGDDIIAKHISFFIKEYFQKFEIFHIPIHKPISFSEQRLISKSKLCFIAGSNALISDIKKNKRLIFEEVNFLQKILLNVTKLIFLGVGSDTYSSISKDTQVYFSSKLKEDSIHSVRDSESAKIFNQAMSGYQCLNTSCPTLWNYKRSDQLYFDGKRKNIILTLTNYNEDETYDNLLIKKIIATRKKIYFFPQNEEDVKYLISFKSYKDNEKQFSILEPSLKCYSDLLKERANDFNYIGTRLHGGIESLHHEVPTLIVCVGDGRASTIGVDTNIPVVKRNEIEKIDHWINGDLKFENINIPQDNIAQWKDQFNKYL